MISFIHFNACLMIVHSVGYMHELSLFVSTFLAEFDWLPERVYYCARTKTDVDIAAQNEAIQRPHTINDYEYYDFSRNNNIKKKTRLQHRTDAHPLFWCPLHRRRTRFFLPLTSQPDLLASSVNVFFHLPHAQMAAHELNMTCSVKSVIEWVSSCTQW